MSVSTLFWFLWRCVHEARRAVQAGRRPRSTAQVQRRRDKRCPLLTRRGQVKRCLRDRLGTHIACWRCVGNEVGRQQSHSCGCILNFHGLLNHEKCVGIVRRGDRVVIAIFPLPTLSITSAYVSQKTVFFHIRRRTLGWHLWNGQRKMLSAAMEDIANDHSTEMWQCSMMPVSPLLPL